MSTLQEIEKAVPMLSSAELDHLETLLKELRRKEPTNKLKKSQRLADFSGVLRLAVDPLAWQKTIRQEWE